MSTKVSISPKSQITTPASKKKASRKKASKKPAVKPTPAASKRLSDIYKLEAAAEKKRAVYTASKVTTKAHKAALGEAEDALAKEIHDQRVGPGPLFDNKKS